ncbi:MAG: DMT family transporter [Bacteroidales bacterium]|jgi:drug/metabolite transporter (DMT)-like permease|nr:DMT family transporter [Bacteroidales bacterium]HOI32482.1 DMT family transporter [Bacteroidales bacterium]
MLYLLATTLLSAAIFVVFKLFKKFEINNLQAITTNYLVASLTALLIYSGEINYTRFVGADWFSIVIGGAFIGVFFLFALSSQKAGIAVTAVSSKMSVAIPTFAGFILFFEKGTLLKVLGIFLALLALYLALRKDEKEKSKLSLKVVLLPVFLFLGTGINDLMMKIADYYFVTDDLLLLLASIFLVALLIGSLALLFDLKKSHQSLKSKNIVAGIFLGLINFGSTYFLFKSMACFDASFLFPVRNAGVVALTALIAWIFFNEKLSRTNWAGIGTAIVAIIMIANN